MLEKIGNVVGSFLEAYGSSFAMMIIAGLLIALFVEYAVKKAFAWLEEKFGDVKWLDTAKVSAIFAVTVIFSVIATRLLFIGELPLPGNKALAPFWFGIIYFCQYIFSMYGIKGLLNLKDRDPKEKAPKEPKPKKVNPVEGFKKISRNCYKDEATGIFYDRKGNRL